MNRRITAIILAMLLTASMISLTACSNSKEEEDLPAPSEDTIGEWALTTEQEDTFEKLTLLLESNGTFYQFNSKECVLDMTARHYVNGQLVDEGDYAEFAVKGEGYLYLDYRDGELGSLYGDIVEPDYQENVVAQVAASLISEENEDGALMEFEINGSGSADTMISLLNTDDGWESGSRMDIPYEKEFDLWAIDLSGENGAGTLEATVSETKNKWMQGECIIITAKFTEESSSKNSDPNEPSTDESDVGELTQDELDAMLEDIKNDEE